MTTTIDATRPSEPAQIVTKHPIRGAIWGLLLGLSIAIYAVLFAIIPFGDWIPLGLCVVAGVGLGVLWAYVAPAKGPTEPPPVATEISDVTETPEVTEAPEMTEAPEVTETPDVTVEPSVDDEDV